MIRIDLVDNTASVKHVDFHVVPVTEARDFRCSPEGVLPLRTVMRLSHKLDAGRTFGHVGKYVWYRLMGEPIGPHKAPLS